MLEEKTRIAFTETAHFTQESSQVTPRGPWQTLLAGTARSSSWLLPTRLQQAVRVSMQAVRVQENEMTPKAFCQLSGVGPFQVFYFS